jgi:glycosyltransferase involved in cell wall biosynthesis
MNAPQLRVCLVAPLPPPYGGIGNWTLLVRRYAQARNDVYLDIVDTAPRWRAIDDLSLWKRAIGGGAQLLRDYVRFLRLLRRRPDVIHLTTSGQLAVVRDIAILATARWAGVRSVYHIRFGRIPQIAQENTREWRMLARAIRLANCVVAIDPATADAIRRRAPQVRTLRIPNGVDLEALPAPGKASALRTVLFLGWVIPAKGMAELVQAWAESVVEGWRCVVAGPGSGRYREELLQRFHPEHLEFLPEQSHDDAMRLMASADVFVLPSHTEGFPNVILEAMALGRPIIAAGVGAIPEMLAGDCGVLVPPKDAAALGAALRRMCSDAALRESVGARARARAHAEYAMARVLEQLVSAWRQGAEAGRDG